MFNLKKAIISFLIFLLFLSSFAFLAPQEIIAQEEETVVQEESGNFITDGIANAIGGAIANFFFGIFDFLLKLGPMLLSFVLSDSFVNQSGSDSPVVQQGWGIVRNIANIALVIGLVVIAINIILGNEEGQAKKTLVNFVIVALLINFTPLLCGFLIDGADIIAKSFMQGELDPNLNNQIGVLKESLAGSGQSIFSTIGGLVAVFIFTIISLVIYALYALLFVARVVILWILIIVSPVALATRVFPRSNVLKKFFPSVLYWDDWLEMFVQWTVIIIPASLFIFLGNKAVAAVRLPPQEEMDLIPFIIQSMFNFLIPLALLLAGFFVTISSGGQVAAPIKAMGKRAEGYMVGKAVAGAKATGKWTKEGAVGAAAAPFAGANPLSKTGRDTGRVAVDKTKARVGGTITTAKDYLRIGERNTWARRSAETETQLAEGMDNYFDGTTKEENIAKFTQAQQQLDKLRLGKSLSKKELSKRYENLFIAATNSGDIEDAAIGKFLNESKEKGTEIDYGKMLKGTSGSEMIKKYKPTALERPFIAKELAGTPQGKFILHDNRATQAHATALTRGIAKSQETETKTEGAKNIGGSSYAGNVAQIDEQEQKLAEELDSFNSKAKLSGLSNEEEARRREVSDQLKSMR